MRTLTVIGLDGLFPDFIETFRTAMPNLARLHGAGLSATLMSTVPPFTPQAWTSMTTGVNPGGHGIPGFTRMVDGTETVLNRTSIQAPQLWDHLSRASITSGLVNIPMTFPAPAVPGFALSGMLTPSVASQGFMHPAGLRDALLAQVPDYVIDTAVHKKDRHHPALWHRLQGMLRSRIAACRHLLSGHDVDCFFCVFVLIDRVCHVFYRFLDPRDPIYDSDEGKTVRARLTPLLKELDAFMGELASESRYVAVVSDHGFRREEGKFYTNRFLADAGFLALKTSLKRWVINQCAALFGRDRLRRWLPRGWIQRGLAATAKTPARMPAGQARSAPLTAQGIEVPDPDVRDRLVSLLETVKDPRDGSPLFTGIHVRDALYHGPSAGCFPDLVLEARQGGVEMSPHMIGKSFLMFTPEDWPGGHHDRRGVFSLSGPSIQPGTGQTEMAMVDVLPTLLGIFNIRDIPRLEGCNRLAGAREDGEAQ